QLSPLLRDFRDTLVRRCGENAAIVRSLGKLPPAPLIHYAVAFRAVGGIGVYAGRRTRHDFTSQEMDAFIKRKRQTFPQAFHFAFTAHHRIARNMAMDKVEAPDGFYNEREA